jgi:hypothetical protein
MSRSALVGASRLRRPARPAIVGGMSLRFVLAPLLALLAPLAQAASSGQALTPLSVSVAGGESQVFSARFYDAFGQPAVGETVRFANDACGTFPNGGFAVEVRTDTTGVATTTFTARPQGITCWLVASAGVQVRFDVLTYNLGNVYFDARLDPPQPLPGQRLRVNAAVKAGAYTIYHADVTARVLPGTSTATLAPGSANTGSQGTAAFAVTPDARPGDYDIELQFRNRVQRVPVRLSTTPWQDMWWGGTGESGWGVSVVQHRDLLFSVIYAYDASGKPTWYVMPGGSWNEAKTTFSGPLYAPRGSPYGAYDAAKFAVGAPVGHAGLAFGDGNDVALDYTIDGVSGRKALSRQLFGPVDTAPGAALGDMWWGGEAQNGWGLALLQQYRTLFGVWFTYDASGAPTWLVMPAGFWSDASTYEGRIYRMAGASWVGRAYDAAALRSSDVGTFRIRFSGDAASLDYVIDGKSGTLALARQPF